MSISPSDYPPYSVLRARRTPRPPGPCEVPGCADRAEAARARLSARRRAQCPPVRHVYEHCHAHDLVRGIACEGCNSFLAWIDARVLMPVEWYRPRQTRPSRLPGVLAHWARCPECAAGGPWSPALTYREWADRWLYRHLGELPSAAADGPAAYAEALAILARDAWRPARETYPTPGQLARFAYPAQVAYGEARAAARLETGRGATLNALGPTEGTPGTTKRR